MRDARSQSGSGGKIRTKLPEPLLIDVHHGLETLEAEAQTLAQNVGVRLAVHSCAAKGA